ncbi:MAG: HAD-IIB family hydrolase, partial [Candidatus Eremiobacterota bacterium]
MSAFDLVVLDLDGTILDPAADPPIRPRVVEAVRAVQERGVAVTLATGRTLPYLEPVARRLGLRLPVVAAGGAVVGNPLTGEVLAFQPVPESRAREALEWASVTGYEVALYLQGPTRLRILQNLAVRPDAYHEHLFGGPRTLVRRPEAYPGERLLKFIVVAPVGDCHPEVERLAEALDPEVRIMRTHPELMEGHAA